MPVHIVMDRNGDSRYYFDREDARSFDDADARFKKLLHKGYLAVAPGEHGSPGRLLRNFEESVEETVFIPPLKGG
jgi:hypothetical protein